MPKCNDFHTADLINVYPFSVKKLTKWCYDVNRFFTGYQFIRRIFQPEGARADLNGLLPK